MKIKYKNLTILKKYLLAIVPTVAICMFVMSLMSTSFMAHELTKHIRQDIEANAGKASALIESKLKNIYSDLELLSEGTLIRGALKYQSYEQVSEHLSRIKSARKVYYAIDLIDQSGTVVASSSKSYLLHLRSQKKDDVSSETWFFDAIGGGTGQSDLIHSNLFDSLVFNFYAPIYVASKSTPVGVLRLVYDWQNIVEEFKAKERRWEVEGHKTREITLLDKDKIVLYSKNPSLLLTLGDEKTFDEKIFANPKKEANLIQGEFVVASLIADQHLPKLGWRIFLFEDEAEALSDVRAALAALTIINLSFLLLLVMAIYWVSKNITDPISEVSSAIKEMVRTKDLRLIASDQTGGEIGDLVSSFNHLFGSLRETTVSKSFVDSVFACMNEMLIILDGRGRIKRINQSASRQLTISEDQLVGKHIKEILNLTPIEGGVVFSSREEIVSRIFSLNNGEEIQFCFEVAGDGVLPVLVTSTELFDLSGEERGRILIARDVRDSKLVKALKEKQLQLIQSAKLASLGELSSGIAHELNNPLHFIKGFNGRLIKLFEKSRVVKKEEVSDYLVRIDENCERMKKIISHFRDFSRQSDQHFERVHINEVIEKAFDLFGEQLKLRAIDLEREYDESNPVVLGNANRLEQVVVNLITNARDALEARSNPRIKVKTKVEGEKVVLRIVDNGEGIPKEKLEKIFNPFFTTKDIGKGTGLGLSIAHGIIEEHGGAIQALSKKGEGTVFEIELKLENSAGKGGQVGA